MKKVRPDNQFYFQWHFLQECNLRCKHCYQGNYDKKEFEFSVLQKIADQIFLALEKWNMYGRIALTGGEPFLSNNLYPLLQYINDNDRVVSIDILSNGTLIGENEIRHLKDFHKLHQVQISLDGGTATEHEFIRGRGTFQKAINAIKLLKSEGISVSIMFTLSNLNKNSYAKAIELAEREKVDAITIERVTPCGHSDLSSILKKEEVKEIYTGITKMANAIPNITIRRARPLWCNTVSLNKLSKATIGGFCPVGYTSLAILWDGTVLPCRRLEIPIGNILKDGIFKIWYGSELLWNIRDKRNLKGKCRNCENIPKCGGCRAIAYAVTGDYMESDPQCWI